MKRSYQDFNTFIVYFFALTASILVGKMEATHGYFPPGYGARSIGMGGTAVANPQDSLVVATNPAGLSFLESRIDSGLTFFMPLRNYSHTLPTKDHVDCYNNLFLIPAFSGVKQKGCNSYGIALYGRGGMNSTYPRDNPVFGANNIPQNMGLDYMQLLLTPTYSRAITQNHAIGISLVYGVQRLRIRGLQGFKPFSYSPEHVTNHGYSYAQGIGCRVGWMGNIGYNVMLGASYGTKVYMSHLNKYKGLLAQHGKLDIPADFNVGFMWQPYQCLQIAFDYQYIFYKDVPAIGHTIAPLALGNLGTKGGAGFGWKNISVYKVGVNYFAFEQWEFRAGYSYGAIPYSSNQVDFNILAPAVTKHHIDFGTTFHINCKNQLDFFYTYAFKSEQSGESDLGLGTLRERMHQYTFGINFAYLF